MLRSLFPLPALAMLLLAGCTVVLSEHMPVYSGSPVRASLAEAYDGGLALRANQGVYFAIFEVAADGRAVRTYPRRGIRGSFAERGLTRMVLPRVRYVWEDSWGESSMGRRDVVLVASRRPLDLRATDHIYHSWRPAGSEGLWHVGEHLARMTVASLGADSWDVDVVRLREAGYGEVVVICRDGRTVRTDGDLYRSDIRRICRRGYRDIEIYREYPVRDRPGVIIDIRGRIPEARDTMTKPSTPGKPQGRGGVIWRTPKPTPKAPATDSAHREGTPGKPQGARGKVRIRTKAPAPDSATSTIPERRRPQPAGETLIERILKGGGPS